MAKIAFIGLGNMGGPMAANLAKVQHHVVAFDLSDAAVSAAVEKGAHKASSAAEAVKGAEIVVTMLPAGKHVREVYEKDVLPNVAKGTLLIDKDQKPQWNPPAIEGVTAAMVEEHFRPVSNDLFFD